VPTLNEPDIVMSYQNALIALLALTAFLGAAFIAFAPSGQDSSLVSVLAFLGR
jgi:hypothetical protein